jgi:hypothetical protein
MIDPGEAEITQKVAVNVVLQSLGEQMCSLIISYLMRHYNVTMSESGDLSCPLYELRLALEQLVGKDAAQLVLQDIYVEIDALTQMVKEGA